MQENFPLYSLQNVGKEFQAPSEKLIIFNNLSFTIQAGESIAIVGASGSGKSTLLHLLGTLDIPSWGTVSFKGKNFAELSQNAKAELRNKHIGFVFQFHHLLPEFTTVENVAMQALIGGMERSVALKKAEEALKLVGLEERQHYRVNTLSGGERQRAAIARAILLQPDVLLADEPTGNLDERTGETVAQLLLRLNKELGMTLVVVTHNNELAACMQRRLELRAGELYDK